MVGFMFVSLVFILIGISITCYAEYRLQEMKKIEDIENYNSTSYHVFTRNEYDDVKGNSDLAEEYQVYRQLKTYEKYGGKFLFDIFFKTDDGRTVKIDLLFLTPKGIFAIKSKNVSGDIYGLEDGIEWVQINKHVNIRFYNPIMQNEEGIVELKNIIGKDLPIYSMIVFSNNAKLKNVPSNVRDTYVLNRSSLNEAIKIILDNTEQLISFKDIEDIQKNLFEFTQNGGREQQAYVRGIYKQLQDLREEKEVLAEA